MTCETLIDVVMWNTA